MSASNEHWSDDFPASASDAYVGARSRTGARVSVAGLAVTVVVLLWWLAVNTQVGQLLDSTAMQAVSSRLDFRGLVSLHFTKAVNETTVAIAVLIAFAVAAARRQLGLGIRVLLMLAVANGLTQLLKVILVRPDFNIGHSLVNSFPSGHVAATASIAVALVVVFPVRGRGMVAFLGFLITAVTSVAVIATAWHRPSDVLASLAIVGASAMILLPTEWDREGTGNGSAFAAAFCSAGAFISGAAFALVARNAPYKTGPVSQSQIEELAALGSPGLLLAAASCLAAVSFAGLLFASLKVLEGTFSR